METTTIGFEAAIGYKGQGAHKLEFFATQQEAQAYVSQNKAAGQWANIGRWYKNAAGSTMIDILT